MRLFLRRLLASATVSLLLTGSTAYAYTESILTNQLRAAKYIQELKSGKEPGQVERPRLKKARTWEGKYTRRKLIHGMDAAEKYARDGKFMLIPDPAAWIFEEKPEQETKKKSKY